MKQTGCRETISFCSLVDQRNSVFRNSRLFDLKVLIPINLCFAVTTSKLIFLFRSLPLWLFVVLFSFFFNNFSLYSLSPQCFWAGGPDVPVR